MAEINLTWAKPVIIRRVVLKEQITLSQRVERFAIDVLVEGQWREAARNTVIGYKRIVKLEPVETTAMRIRILDARVAPTMKFVGVYP